MTFEDVVERMQKLRGQMKWQLKGIRTILVYELAGRADGARLCPLTALLAEEQRQVMSNMDWDLAAEQLSIPLDVADRVVEAADGCVHQQAVADRKALAIAFGMKGEEEC